MTGCEDIPCLCDEFPGWPFIGPDGSENHRTVRDLSGDFIDEIA